MDHNNFVSFKSYALGDQMNDIQGGWMALCIRKWLNDTYDQFIDGFNDGSGANCGG